MADSLTDQDLAAARELLTIHDTEHHRLPEGGPDCVFCETHDESED